MILIQRLYLLSLQMLWALAESRRRQLGRVGAYPLVEVHQMAVTLPLVVCEGEFGKFCQRLKNVRRKRLQLVVSEVEFGQRTELFKHVCIQRLHLVLPQVKVNELHRTCKVFCVHSGKEISR